MRILEQLPQDYLNKKIAWVIRHSYRYENQDKLTEQGKIAAATFGKKLIDRKINAIYSSPATRCIETAQILTENLGKDIPIILDNTIAEQGVYITDMEQALNIYHFLGKQEYFKRLLTNEPLPGHERFSVAGEKITDFIKNNTFENGITLFITHHFIIRMLNHYLKKLTYKDPLLKVEPLQGIFIEI